MSLTEKSSFGFVSSCVSTKQLLFVGTEQCIYTRFFFGPFSSRLTSFGQIFFLINFRFVIYLSNNIIIRMISYKPNEKKNMSFRNSRSLTVDPFLVDFFRTNLWHSTYLHLIFWTMYANYSMRFLIIYFFMGPFNINLHFVKYSPVWKKPWKEHCNEFFRKNLNDWEKKSYHIIFQRKIVWVWGRLWHLKAKSMKKMDILLNKDETTIKLSLLILLS